MSDYRTALDYAIQGAPRKHNVWVLVQPNGNYFATDRMRDPVYKDAVAVAVVRKNQLCVEYFMPRAWGGR